MSRTAVVWLIIFVIASVLVVVWSRSKNNDSVVTEYLSKFDTSAISSDGLALYWLYAKNDPLMAIPGSDIAKLEKQLEVLDVLLISVTDTYSAEENKLINETLYPTDFLRDLAELERQRQQLIGAPTKETADNYHKQLTNTLSSYETSLDQMIKTLSTLEPSTFGFLAGTTSAPVIASRLNSVSDSLSRLSDLEKLRYRCLTEPSASCVDLNWQAGSEPIVTNTIPFTIDPNIWGNKEALDAFYTKNTASSTLIVLDESYCYPQTDPVVYAYWDELNDLLPNVRFIRATPVNDLFLQDLRSSPDNAYYKSLLDSGLEYSLQPMNLYFCVDGGIEYQKLTTIKKIYDLANKLSTPSGSDLPADLLSLLASLPKPTNEGVLFEAPISDHINKIRRILNNYTERELVSYLGTDNYSNLRETELLWRTQSADLDKLIDTANYMTETNRGVLDITDIPLEPLYLTRSYISLLFQLGNETINQETKILITQPDLQSLDSFIMVSGNSLFPTKADKKKLEDMLIENRRLAP